MLTRLMEQSEDLLARQAAEIAAPLPGGNEARALHGRLSPPAALLDAAITLSVHGQIPRDELLRALETGGYRQANQVADRGEYSLRGNLLDLFPPTGHAPVRAEFFGDELLSLREFNPATQRP